MAAPTMLPVLGEVTTGYTGNVTITVGATVATYTSKAAESPLSVLLGLMAESYLVHGAGFAAWVDSSDKINIAYSGGVFSIGSSGTTQTRLGLTGALSGAPGYTFPNAYSDALAPGLGLHIDGAWSVWDGGGQMSDGALGRLPWLTGFERTLSVYDTAANLMTHQATLDDGGTWDMYMYRAGAGPSADRFRVLSTMRQRLMAVAGEWSLTCRVMAVRR